MTEVNAVWGQMMVTINGKVEGMGADIGDMVDVINNYISTNELNEEDFARKEVKLYNIVGKVLDSHNHFRFEFKNNDPYIGEAHEGTTDDYEYEVEDTGKKFDDMDSLKDYLSDLIKNGDYTADEVRRFDIRQTMTNNISFEDAMEGDLEIDFDWTEKGGELIDLHHGREFVLASEVEEYVCRRLQDWIKDNPPVVSQPIVELAPSHMSDDELEDRITLLDNQLTTLMRERRRRQL